MGNSGARCGLVRFLSAVVGGLLSLCAGCGSGGLDLADDAKVLLFATQTTIYDPLAKDIRTVLQRAPDSTRKEYDQPAAPPSLEVGGYTLYRFGDALVLIDREGWRVWKMPGLGDQLAEVNRPARSNSRPPPRQPPPPPPPPPEAAP